MTTIGHGAFYGCTALSEVICLTPSSPQVADSAFHNVGVENCNLFVRYNKVEEYSNADVWKDFASISQMEYLMSYIVDGETYKSEVIHVDADIVPEIDLVKEGCTFSGWSEIPPTMPANDVVITGSFIPNKYELAYIVDGDTVSTELVDYSTEITAIEEPAKEGYTFSGWSEVPSTMPANDVVVIGSFTINQYNLAYVVDGDTISAELLDYGTEITAIEEPAKEGYTFSGWSEVPSTLPANDVVVTGSFIVNQYELSYIVEGDTVSTELVDYGTVITAIEEPAKEGYTFSGWSEIPSTMPANDVVVIGSFTINQYNLAYVVDGDTISAELLDYGTEITAVEEPAKEGYTFSGWSEIPSTMPANDVVVTGSFTINQYNLSYIVDGDTISAELLDYGTEIAAIDEPTKEGYTFSGWSEIPSTMPAGDVVVSGSFAINSYAVIYMVGEEEIRRDTVQYGAEIPEYVYESGNELIVFNGWIGEKYENMPAHDITFVADITDLQLGVNGMSSHDGNIVIYTINGAKIHTEDMRTLPSGVYIVNGKKIYVK